MSYEEAMELSYFGAKIIHSSTIAPAVAENIPVLIKNTLNPSAKGTLISRSVENWKDVAKGITSINDISLINLRGLSMVGVPGTAARLFRALAAHNVNVILISQASSEHTICFAIQSSFLHIATKALKEEFSNEFLAHNITLDIKPKQTIVAIVGEGMKGTPGVAGKVFSALGQNNINIAAIAQGASERNISFVVDSSQQIRTLNVIHQAFFEKKKKLSLVVLGIGNIGTALIQQLMQQEEFLLKNGYDVRVCAIANSTKSLCNPNGINLRTWKNEFETSAKPAPLSSVLQFVSSLEIPNSALVDCTASQAVVDRYIDCVEANMHIVTPNKKANVLPLQRYEEFMHTLQHRHKYFLYEANVGAGLPIISTLNDLISCGDTILKIEGIFSGTLSYLFNNFDGTIPFSTMLENTYAMAYTEPDPREDLSGMDVARKLLILARQIGYAMDVKNIQVENLVPRRLRQGKFSKKFFTNITKFDAQILKRYEATQKKGCALRYVGTLEGTNATAGLKAFPQAHPFASTRGSDNIVAFTTQRYLLSPLVVQGPGAGAEITAMGVFSDILKLLHYLPY
jgi:aspartokinase/homoserine dehydrogenase 1